MIIGINICIHMYICANIYIYIHTYIYIYILAGLYITYIHVYAHMLASGQKGKPASSGWLAGPAASRQALRAGCE